MSNFELDCQNTHMKTKTLKLGFAIIAGLAAFGMVVLSGGASGILIAMRFTHPHWHGYLPHSYWPTVWVVTGLLAIPSGIHSYRATRKYYRKTDGVIGDDHAA